MKCGFDRAGSEKALAPLFLHNCQNVVKTGTAEALTGPVERGDAETVLHHLQTLSEKKKRFMSAFRKFWPESQKKKIRGGIIVGYGRY